MTSLQTQNEKMDAALSQAFAVREANSDTLAARLNDVRRAHRIVQAKRQQRRLMLRRGLALASVLFAVTLSATVLPRILVWRALAQMADATENVRSMHTIGWAIEDDGTRRKISEMWSQNGLWRIERPHDVQIYADEKLFRFEPRARLATWVKKVQGPFGFNPSGFSIRAITADIARRGWQDKITLSPDEQTIDGRRARVATIEPAREKIRIVFYADPQTMLPFRNDLLHPTRDGWKVASTSTTEYNLPLEAKLFEPKFPAGTRVVEAGAGRGEWVRSLQKSKAVLLAGQQRIVIRDVQMNEQGDVFVLYTAGRAQDVASDAAVMMDVPNIEMSLSSANNTEFLQIQPFARPSMGFFAESEAKAKSGHISGVMVGGEPLQWMVWTRLDSLSPQQLDRSQTLHLQMGRNSTGNTSYTTNVPRATFALVPDYVRYFPSGMTDIDFQNTVDEMRAHVLKVSANGKRDQLQKALGLYRIIIERTEQQWREQGNQGVQPDKWLAVAALCLDLKRLDEAEEALQRAEDDDRIYGNNKRDIAEFKQKLESG